MISRFSTFRTALLAGLAFMASSAMADITIGVNASLTGPISGAGIPFANAVKLFPTHIAGERLKVVVMDDGSDTTKAVQNAHKMVAEENIDLALLAINTGAAIASSKVYTDASTAQFFLSPLPCRLAQTSSCSVWPSRRR